jgi:hypothetical protein
MSATTVFEIVPADGGFRAVATMRWGSGQSCAAGPLCFDVFATLAAAQKWLTLQFGIPDEAWSLNAGRVSAERLIVEDVVSWQRPAG